MEGDRYWRAETQRASFQTEPINDVQTLYPPKNPNYLMLGNRSMGYFHPHRHHRHQQKKQSMMVYRADPQEIGLKIHVSDRGVFSEGLSLFQASAWPWRFHRWPS
jgi:hypothetical protein